MRSLDAKLFQAVDATPDAFTLMGGKYAVAVVATWNTSGTVGLQVLGPDGSTYLSVSAATDFSADGFATVDLPHGTYKFVIDTATGVSAGVARTPGE